MAKINLLPWRAERRKQRQQEFVVILGGVVFAAIMSVYLMSNYYAEAVAYQQQRNALLEQENKVLDAKIQEISNLKNTRQQLIERMKLIQNLQGNRPVIVRLFDELVRIVPDDLYFTSIEVRGNDMRVVGVAKSNSRVATLMRNFDQSDWFAEPTLIRVHAKGEGLSDFEITLKRTEPAREGE